MKKDFNEVNTQVLGYGGHLGGGMTVSEVWGNAKELAGSLGPPPSLPLSSYFLRLFVVKMEIPTLYPWPFEELILKQGARETCRSTTNS